MGVLSKAFKGLCVSIGILYAWMFCLTITVFFDRPVKVVTETVYKCDTIYLKEEIQFDTMQANIQNMYKVCDSLGIKFPKIVVSQAILESGNFKSNLFKKSNNPLGLYDSKNRRYFKFNHWTESVEAYKNMIEYRHKEGEDYYDFLNRIGYAGDKNYNKAIKQIQKDYELH